MNIQVLIFSILQLFFIHALFGQFTAPELNFLNSKPVWTYIPQDANFEFSPQDPRSTPYSRKGSWRLDIQNDNIYLFQVTSSQNPYVGYDGFILHQLDLSSGTASWSLHNNYNSGLTHREYYFSSHFEYTNDSKLKIIGLKDFEPLDTTKPNFFFYGKPFIKTIDLQSGKIDNMIESTATKHSQLYSSTGYGTFNRYTRIGEQYYTFISNAYIENDTLKDAIEMRKINEPFDIDSLGVTAIINNTQIPTDLVQLSMRPIYNFVNDSTIIALFTIKQPEDLSISPDKVWLSKIIVTKDGEMKVLKEVDIRNEFYFPQDQNFNYYKIIKDKNIFVYQTMDSENSPYPSKMFTWLLWADEDCNKKVKIDALHVGDRFYYFPEFISATADKVVLSAYFEDEAKQIKGFDLLEINQSGEIIRLGGFHVSTSAPKILLQRAAISADSSLIVAFRTEVTMNSGFTDYSYVMKFGPDILKPTLTQSTDVDFSPLSFNLAPNPTKDIISITIQDDINSSSTINILDYQGSALISKAIDSSIIEIDLSKLNAGTYFVSMINQKGKQIGQLKKFVKI